MALCGENQLNMIHNQLKGSVIDPTFGSFSNNLADGSLNHILYRDSWLYGRYQNQTFCYWQFFLACYYSPFSSGYDLKSIWKTDRRSGAMVLKFTVTDKYFLKPETIFPFWDTFANAERLYETVSRCSPIRFYR